jgi:hypothetical protein
MTLREAIEQYVVWRRVHGAKFTTAANALRRFLGYVDGDAACDTVTPAQVLAFLAGKGRRHGTARTSILPLLGSGVTRSVAAMRAARRCRTTNRNRLSGLRRTFIRATSCDGSSIPRMWRSTGGVRFNWTRDIPDPASPVIRRRAALRRSDAPHAGECRSGGSRSDHSRHEVLQEPSGAISDTASLSTG